MLRAWHDESFFALRLVEAFNVRSCPLFVNRRDGRRELSAFRWVQNIELQIRVRGRSKSENAGLRRVHAGR